MPPEVVIRTRGLEKSFGTNKVLAGIDLDLYRSENLVVRGRSGTGKSVLLRTIVGLNKPTAGTIEVLDRLMPSPSVICSAFSGVEDRNSSA